MRISDRSRTDFDRAKIKLTGHFDRQLFTPLRSMSVSRLFFSYLNFTMITVDNIYHSQNVSSKRDKTLTVTCSHNAETAECRYGFKLLR